MHEVKLDFAGSPSQVAMTATSTQRLTQTIIWVSWQIPHHIILPVDLCDFLSAVVGDGHPLDHMLYLFPSPGRARVARG